MATLLLVLLLLLQVGEPYGCGRFQEFRKLGHNDRQDGDHEGIVSDPVLPVGGLDLRHEFFLRHGLPAKGNPYLLLFFLPALLVAFQVLGIDPVVFSHFPADRGDDRPVFMGVVAAFDNDFGITVANQNRSKRSRIGRRRRRMVGVTDPSVSCSSPTVALFRWSFLEHSTGSPGLWS